MAAPIDLTETGMANGALAIIGEPPVSSLDDPSRAAARIAKAFFAEARDELLRDKDWEFARNSCFPPVLLAAPNAQWAFRYAMPADCIAIIRIGAGNNPNIGWDDNYDPPWESPSSGDDTTVGVMLDTNETAPFVWYTRRTINPAQWDPEFRRLFKIALAAQINPIIGRDKSLTAQLAAEGGLAEDKAAKRDAKQRNGDQVTRTSSWVLSRWGFTSWRA